MNDFLIRHLDQSSDLRLKREAMTVAPEPNRCVGPATATGLCMVGTGVFCALTLGWGCLSMVSCGAVAVVTNLPKC